MSQPEVVPQLLVVDPDDIDDDAPTVPDLQKITGAAEELHEDDFEEVVEQELEIVVDLVRAPKR